MFKKITKRIIEKRNLLTDEDDYIFDNKSNLRKLNFLEYFYIYIFEYNIIGYILKKITTLIVEIIENLICIILNILTLLFLPVVLLVDYFINNRE